MIVNERYLQEHNVSPPPREPFVPKLACSHVKDMKIDGVWFEAGKCTDPGCPVHGLEAKVKAMARPIVITPNDETTSCRTASVTERDTRGCAGHRERSCRNDTILRTRGKYGNMRS